jgi:hypothetical protein
MDASPQSDKYSRPSKKPLAADRPTIVFNISCRYPKPRKAAGDGENFCICEESAAF